MREAADQFTTAGGALSGVFEQSKSVTSEMVRTASSLSNSAQDVQAVVSDYRQARETFEGIVEALRGTVETAKREVSMTSDLVRSLEGAAQQLRTAQGQADEYLSKVNGALVEAHTSFSTQMLKTVGEANGDFHKQLSTATGMLASTINELDGVVIEFGNRRK